MHLQLTCALWLLLCGVHVAAAQSSPEAQILWQQALVLLARNEQGEQRGQQLLKQACEAGCWPACMQAASICLDEDDLESAEELLRSAQAIAPHDPEGRLALARVMAARGNMMWAFRALQALEREGHDVSFELGYCLHELDMHEQAAAALAQSAMKEDEDSHMAALYAAVSLEELDRFDEAETMAERASRAEHAPNVVAAASSLQQALRRYSGFERVILSGFATVAGGYDSNPIMAPDEAPTYADGARLWLVAGLWSEPVGGSFFTLGARLSASRDQSFDIQARPFDYTAATARIYSIFRYNFGVPNEVRLSYRYAIGLLDGGPGVEENQLYAYSESHVGALSYSLALSDIFTTRLRVETGWNIYHNRARTGVPLRLAVGQSTFLLSGRLKIYGEAGVQKLWARSPKYERSAALVNAAISYLTGWWDLELMVAWSYQWSFYTDSRGADFSFDYTRPDVRRKDSSNVLSFDVGRNFLDRHLRLALRYRFTDSSSSIATYDYSRHAILLGVTGGF